MLEKRVKIQSVVENQLPGFLESELQGVGKFLKTYYKSQEYQGGPVNILENIDQYVKVGTYSSIVGVTSITADVTREDSTISVQSTNGWPDQYGLLKIGNEIISYTGKTSTTFTGCIRGFCGITSYHNVTAPDELIFEESSAEDHTAYVEAINLSSLFLKEFFRKLKNQFLPGLQDVDLYDGLKSSNFIKQSVDFYRSKGTPDAFEILFRALYNEDVDVIKPQDYLFTPSDAEYSRVLQLCVEPLEGDPRDLKSKTVFQETSSGGTVAYGSVVDVEELNRDGTTFYRIGIDYERDKDINVHGSIYGEFKLDNQTKVIENVAVGQTFFNVESTIGFPDNGEIFVTYSSGDVGVVTYKSRNVTQFIDCTGVLDKISDTQQIFENGETYGFDDNGDRITFKIKGSLGEYKILATDADTSYYTKDDIIKVQSLGYSKDNLVTDTLIANETSIFEIKNAETLNLNQLGQNPNIISLYQITSYEKHGLNIGDTIEVVYGESVVTSGIVNKILSDYTIDVSGLSGYEPAKLGKIRRLLTKVNAQNANVQTLPANVLHSFYDDNNNVYLASHSLPSYKDPIDVKTGNIVLTDNGFSSTAPLILTGETIDYVEHDLFTGDEVYYRPDKFVELEDGYGEPVAITTVRNLGDLVEGRYFATRVNEDKFKLSASRSDIFKGRYLSIAGIASHQTIFPIKSYENQVDSSYGIRKIPSRIEEVSQYWPTEPGTVGVFINGVDVLSYKSNDYCYYGNLTGVEIVAEGTGYDVINPPRVIIDDGTVGSGATATAAVKGVLEELVVDDSGYDFVTTPVITISGGNGTGARAVPNTKKKQLVAYTDVSSGAGYISTSTNIVGFSSYHKFRMGDGVVYSTNEQTAIGIGSTVGSKVRDTSLVNKAIYYVRPESLTSVTLYETRKDSLAGVSTINITDHGIGNQYFTTVDQKEILTSIIVESSGSNYSTNQIRVAAGGISSSRDQIVFNNHGFKTGELITYKYEGSIISGLTTDQNYYIKEIDNNTFQLAAAGIGTTLSTYNLDNKLYVDLKDTGIGGTHIFNYPDITINISGSIGIGTTNNLIFQPTIKPKFRGEVYKLNLQAGGTGYGCSDIINFERQPLITFENGSGSQLKPLVVEGKIREVLVINGGSGYDSIPDLKIIGSGKDASLTPVLVDGVITTIQVNDGGSGFTTATTFCEAIPIGTQAKARVSIKKWNVNQFEKDKEKLSVDDGLLIRSQNQYSKGSYASISAPRGLREIVYSMKEDGSKNYGAQSIDLVKLNDIEITSSNHSPILGWSFDGIPIYGPFGYSDPQGGNIREILSSYELLPPDDRPTGFPVGFFVEDYSYTGKGDLDDHNGRFAKTPDFPNGIYAYYTTINPGAAEGFGAFMSYKYPQFPYVIGDTYKAKPDTFNHNRQINQVEYNYYPLWRNTKPSKTSDVYGYNEYLLDTSRDPIQIANVQNINKGVVDEFSLVATGSSYKSGERIVLDEHPKRGTPAALEIGRIRGKDIVSIASSTVTAENLELFVGGGVGVGYCTAPHGFYNKNRVTISGLSTQSYHRLNGLTNIFNRQRTWYVGEYLAAPATTGLTTTVNLIGPYDPLYMRENTVIGIGTTAENLEHWKVLNVDPLNQRVRVQRNYNGTTGVAYSSRTLALELPSTFSFRVGIDTYISQNPNFQRYFDPGEVVGLGTTAVIGIGSTVSYHPFNNIAPPYLPENNDYEVGIAFTSKIIPVKTILIQNHSFQTGDTLTYASGGGLGIVVSDGIGTFRLSDNDTVYAIKESNNLLGISTTKVGLGSTGSYVGLGSTAIALSFMSVGSGVTHSFTIDNSPITANAQVNEATIQTAEPHGLKFNDQIRLVPLPNLDQIIFVQYNDYNRRIVFDRKKFEPSGVNTTTYNINVPNHDLSDGDKVIYTTGGTAVTGLNDQGMYYTIKVDSNNIKLAANKLNAVGFNPIPVSLTGTGSGEQFVSKINPKVEAVTGNTVSFACTDSSLSASSVGVDFPAFKLEFYRDPQLNDLFVASKEFKKFEVLGIGTIGVTNPAAVNLKTNDSIPDTLYYKFSPVNVNLIPSAKAEIMIDYDQSSANTVDLVPSVYQASEYPTGIGSTTFSYILNKKPEQSSYAPAQGSFYYTHESTNATGAVDSVNIKTGGTKYETLPGITSIITTHGKNAIIRLAGSMGSINKIKLQDNGYNYSSDPTLKVVANAPEILKVEELNSFESIGITSGGKGYNVAPNLVVIDPITNKKVENVHLEAKVKNGSVNEVKIIENTKNLSDTEPTLLTINNPNGVGITTVGFNSISNEVTLQLSVGYSTAGSFPFSVGDKIFVENVGIASTGSGYNSVDYNYKFFDVTSIDENIGGIGSVSYKLDPDVNNPGLYSTARSYGRVVSKGDFPTFDPVLIKNDFSLGEVVQTQNVSEDKATFGVVSSWDHKNKILKVNAKEEFTTGTKIQGKGSGTVATIYDKVDIDSWYKIEASPLVVKGWRKDNGKPNLNYQRLIDSDYYQYFSYSLKSKIAYETWNDIVSSMNHTIGYKKFSDLVIESQTERDMVPLIEANDVELGVEIITEISTFCNWDFDLVSEKYKNVSGDFFSDSVLLRNIPITDYEESVGNRVLSIDDFSGSFNNTPRATRYSVVDTFPVVGTRFRRYHLITHDTQWVGEREMSVIELLLDNDGNGFIQEYGDVQTELEGYFDYQQIGSEGQLLFYPTKYEDNNYDIHGLVYNVDRDTHSAVGLATLVGFSTLGDIASIESRGTTIPAGITTAVNIIGISTTDFDGSKLSIVMEQGDRHESLNLSVIHNRNSSYGVEYGNMGDNDNESLASPTIGTFGSSVSGGVLYINCTPSTSGAAVTFNMLVQKFHAGVSTVGIATSALTTGDLRAQYTNIAASGSPGVSTVATFGSVAGDEEGAHAIIQIRNNTDNRYDWIEGIFLGDSAGTYQALYGGIEDHSGVGYTGIGTIGSNLVNGEYHIQYTPPASKDVTIKTYVTSAAQVQGGDDEIRLIDLLDSKIESMVGAYAGTNADVLRSFGLYHGDDEIFQKNIDSTDPLIVNLVDNLIIMPNHFFTTGELLTYNPTGSGTTSAIGIGTTTISGISTDKLPTDVYAIKVDDKSIRVAGSAEDALVSAQGDYLELTTVGIGTSHSFTSRDSNTKCVVALDNNLQDPVIPANIEHNLVEEMSYGGELMRISGITSFFGNDLLKVDDEFMYIKQVGFGSTNVLVVKRGWMGTGFATHANGATVEKYEGGYNIVDNTINFFSAPNGVKPKEIPTDPDEIDWTGIATHSTFQGRVFLRNGQVGTTTNTYSTNILFDSISPEFNGVGKTFTLREDGENVSGFSTNAAFVLVNDIAQMPTQGARINTYELTENAGITSIIWSGYGASVRNDVNTGTVPVGGVIVSVGSTQGYGYQPLVAAGGTAVISGFGTVSSISIGNTGSGYRAGIATLNGVVQEITVNVGVRTADLDEVDVVAIGTATILGGAISSVAISTGGIGYTWTNPPKVVFDDPIPYSNMPLIYHPDSTGAGLGTNAFVDVIVSQDSDVIDFNIINSGYGYRNGELLTIPEGGLTGIPRDLRGNPNGPIVSGGSYAHTFVSAASNCVHVNSWSSGTYKTPTTATYNPATGDLVLTKSSHGLTTSDKVGIVTNSLTFTCDMDSNATNHTYPRILDPVAGIMTGIGATTANTFTVNVGKSPAVPYSIDYATYEPTTGKMVLTIGSHNLDGVDLKTPSNAVYDPVSGITTLTVNNHKFNIGDRIMIADGGLTFVCAEDGGATEHAYPRSTDPFSNKWMPITARTANTFTVKVLETTPSTNTGIHTFVSATTNCVTRSRSSVKLVPDSIRFSCSSDDYQTPRSYPRANDPYYDLPVPIEEVEHQNYTITNAAYAPTTGLLTLTVPGHNFTKATTHTPTGASYAPTTGEFEVTLDNHGFSLGDRVLFALNSFTFTCAEDSHGSDHTYPRLNDPANRKWLSITKINTPNNFTVNVGVSTNTTAHTFKSATTNGISRAEDQIKITDGSIRMTCATDGNSTFYAYPRDTDPARDAWLPITATTTNTFKVNVGISSDTSAHSFHSADTNTIKRQTGKITLNVGRHGNGYTHRFVGAGFSDFRLDLQRCESDKFTAWRFGDLTVLDRLDEQFDGESTVFTLKKDRGPYTIRAAKGSLIDVELTILVFLNDVLQEPGKAYNFPGGSNITFTEAPKVGDTCQILFYKGTGDVDVISKDVLQTIKTGDIVQILNGDNYSESFTQRPRSVVGILTADVFESTPYAQAGLTTDTVIQRPLKWCKQQSDLVINGQQITKNRQLYEAGIIPNSNIIAPVGLGSTEIWVQSVIPLFNSYAESIEDAYQKVDLLQQGDKISAGATAVVSDTGTVSSIVISNTGLGYTAAPLVTLANPVGLGSTTRATATASITGTAVTSVSVTSAGSGYTFTSPPVVLIAPPEFETEQIKGVEYSGGFGVITGVGTTSVGLASTGLVFDLLIPLESDLRSTSIMGPGAGRTIPNIAAGYPFVVYNSNIGSGVTSLDLSGSTLGIGTTFIDNVYEAVSVSVATTEAVGFGTTYVAKVTVSLEDYNGLSGLGFSGFYGEYSWGKLRNFSRPNIAKAFTPNLSNGLTGLSTGPIAVRNTPLKTVGYRT